MVTATLKRDSRRGGFFSRSPRARARGFYGARGGVARVNSPASRASAEEDRNPVGHGVCDIQAPSASWGTVTERRIWSQPGSSEIAGGVAFIPAVPGLAPGAFMGQGEGLPVLSRRRWKPSAGRMPKDGFHRASGRQDAESERPARWHGQAGPTEGAGSTGRRGIVRHGVTDLRGGDRPARSDGPTRRGSSGTA